MRRATIFFLSAAAIAVAPIRAAGQDSTAAAADPGKSAFESYCSPCHGTAGKGDGPAGAGLQPPPRDFTSGEFKYGADLASVEHTIGNGVTGTGMPAWGQILEPEEIEAVAKYVMAFAPGESKKGAPAPSGPAAGGKKAEPVAPQAPAKPSQP